MKNDISLAGLSSLFGYQPMLKLREGFKKSKWKFKMAFAMKGGGSRGGLECHLPILKNDFFKNHLESFPDCENVFCT